MPGAPAAKPALPIQQEPPIPVSQGASSNPLDFLDSVEPVSLTALARQHSSTPRKQQKQVVTRAMQIRIAVGVIIMLTGLAVVVMKPLQGDGNGKSNDIRSGTPSPQARPIVHDQQPVTHFPEAYQQGYAQGSEVARRMGASILNFMQSVGANWNEGTNQSLKLMVQNVARTDRNFCQSYAQVRNARGDDNEAAQRLKGMVNGFRDVLLELHVISSVEQLDQD